MTLVDRWPGFMPSMGQTCGGSVIAAVWASELSVCLALSQRLVIPSGDLMLPRERKRERQSRLQPGDVPGAPAPGVKCCLPPCSLYPQLQADSKLARFRLKSPGGQAGAAGANGSTEERGPVVSRSPWGWLLASWSPSHCDFSPKMLCFHWWALSAPLPPSQSPAGQLL